MEEVKKVPEVEMNLLAAREVTLYLARQEQKTQGDSFHSPAEVAG